jgi:hypothetical protein
MLSFQLFVAADTMGPLNLCSRRSGAFDDRARGLGAILAAHAALAMDAAREKEHADQLEHAVQSNRRIGMAMGILMARRQLTGPGLRPAPGTSQYLNVKIRDLAERVVETGELPGRAAPE